MPGLLTDAIQQSQHRWTPFMRLISEEGAKKGHDVDERPAKPRLGHRALPLTRTAIFTTIVFPALGLLAMVAAGVAIFVVKPEAKYILASIPAFLAAGGGIWKGVGQYSNPDTLHLDDHGFSVVESGREYRRAWSQCVGFTVPEDPKTFGVLVKLQGGKSYLLRDGFGGMNDYSMADLLERYRQAAAAESEEVPTAPPGSGTQRA